MRAKNDRRVVFAPRRLKAGQRHWWAFYLRALLKVNGDWLAKVYYVHKIYLKRRGRSYIQGFGGFYAATSAIYTTWGISSGTTTYPLTYWTATTS